jgi:pimeloyl-ACP methyl ester carboxylesterase
MNSVTLVLLPGLDGTGRLFEPLLGVLPAYLKPIVISYPPDIFLTYSELREHVLRRLPSDVPFFLISESFGGPLALEVAATAPSGLAGVVLCATFISNPTQLSVSLAMMTLNASLFKIDPPAFIVRWFLVGTRASDALVKLVQDVLRSCNPYVMASRVRATLYLDARDVLRRCHAPILYLIGTNDRLVKSRSLDEILAVQPEAMHETIDAPHFLLQREPGRGAAAIDRFVRGTMAL